MAKTRDSERPIRHYIEDLLNELDGLDDDIRKFDEKGIKNAGTRIRVALSDVAKQCKEIRALILERRG